MVIKWVHVKDEYDDLSIIIDVYIIILFIIISI